jgi:VWFA-related protein
MVDAANRVLQALRLDDQVAIATFTVGVTKLLDWRTRRGPSLQMTMPPGGGGTALYRALEWTAHELDRVSGRKGVLVMTDGLDETLSMPKLNLPKGSPPYSYEEAAFQMARVAMEQSGAPFYFVAVRPAGPESIISRARQRMSELADRSGGRVVYTETIADVAVLYERLARELGSSYSLAYATTRPQKDGTYRRIEVKVKNPQLRVSQSRAGYYAWAGDSPAPQQAAPPNSREVPALQ